MRLKKARIKKYRSVRDTEFFEIDFNKTILVGPNEAGKTAVLQALQQLNPPKDIPGFDPLRDYPRSEYNDITTDKVDPKNVTIVEGHFRLEPSDLELLPDSFCNCVYVVGKQLDNERWHRLDDAPTEPVFSEIEKDLLRLCSHIDSRIPAKNDEGALPEVPSESLKQITDDWNAETIIKADYAAKLQTWLKSVLHLIDETNPNEEKRYDRLISATSISLDKKKTLEILWERKPIFVLFSNYFRVHPIIHLAHLAERIEKNLLDDETYDYGNKCLLQLLGFSARELSNLGKAAEPPQGDTEALRKYRDQLDSRSYQLNAASVRLTDEIRAVWRPDPNKAEADRLRVVADAQYLKVIVEDDLGVEIELDQRSEGFQWLVSFFVVFFAEASGKHQNAILLLDEPGLSLHGLKQRDFRETISKLAKSNQTIYTTHSPFLVGPGELDIVRVVEMPDRKIGTRVHTEVAADDPASLLPLQEALGYDLAQSLFAEQRNLVLEGLTDYWYLEATSALLRDEGIVDLNKKIALVPANSAGKVVYYATILHAQKLKVAAMLDSDQAGDQAANQDTLVHLLGNKRILRTKDYFSGTVQRPEIEDLLRETLIEVAKNDFGWDVAEVAAKQPKRPIVDIFSDEISDFSKYRLAKAYIRWTRNHNASSLTKSEQNDWINLITTINQTLK